MNFVLEIQKTSSRRQGYSVFGFFFTSSCSSIFLIRVPLYFAYLLTLLQVSCQTDSKILTGTLNNSQVSLITRPHFLQYQFSSLKYSPSNRASLLSQSMVSFESSQHNSLLLKTSTMTFASPSDSTFPSHNLDQYQTNDDVICSKPTL